MRRTKIVATIGPASREPETLTRMVEAGMDVARLNYSHGTLEEHAETALRVRDAAIKRHQYAEDQQHERKCTPHQHHAPLARGERGEGFEGQ